MGIVKKFERSSKRFVMRLLGKFVSSEKRGAGWFRDATFKKILVIRQHNQMGDMLLAVPALRAIKETRPEAEVGIITSTLNRGVLLNNPYINHLFTYDKRSPLSHLKLIRDLRKERYELVIVLHTVSFSFTSVLLAILSGARLRIGSAPERLHDALTGSYFSLTLPLPGRNQLEAMNESEHNLFPLRAIGMDTQDLSPLMVPARESRLWAEEFDSRNWRGEGLRLAVHPGAGKTENIWPPDGFARVINRLNNIQKVKLVVIEGPRDAASVETFLKTCEVEGVVVRGKKIGDVAALLLRADLVICNDTGVMHVSAAVGANTLAVFGPTDPGRWAPKTKFLHVVRAPEGRLQDLSSESVAEKAAGILGLVPRAKGNSKR